MQHSCSHSNAICNNSFKNRIELRTQEQPLVAKHIGRTMKRTQQHPPHRRGTFFRRLQPLYTKNTGFRAPASSPKHNPCNIHAAIPMQSCNQRFKNRIEVRTQVQPLVAKQIGGTICAWRDPSRIRRTDEVPFFGGCSHFTRKNTRFRAPVSWPKKTHATFMLCNRSFKNRIELRTQEQPLVGKHIGGTIRAWNDPSRTSRTDKAPFIAGCSHFTRKNTRFRALASSPKHSPCNIHAAIPMRSCNQKFKNRIELRTQEQPLVAKHIGGTIRAWNDPSRTRRTDEVPFFATCRHFTRKNARFHAPASSPKHNPCNIHAAIPMRSCNQRFKNRIELRTQEQPLVAKHIGGKIKGTQPQHRRGTFLRRMQWLYTEKHKVSCCGFLTQKNPCNIHAAIAMRSATTASRTA